MLLPTFDETVVILVWPFWKTSECAGQRLIANHSDTEYIPKRNPVSHSLTGHPRLTAHLRRMSGSGRPRSRATVPAGAIRG